MKRQLAILILLAGVAAFVLGLFHLLKLRYEAGDVYPEYSSLRADPLGTMALYEALGRMPGVTVTRDYSAINRLPPGRSTTYLHLAASRLDWMELEEELMREVDMFVTAGGRLVISFSPEYGLRAITTATTRGAPPPPGKKKSSRSKQEEERALRRISPEKAWGFEFGRVSLQRKKDGTFDAVTVNRRTDLELPAELSWHSPIVFTNLDRSWETIYARGTDAVMAERKFGRGSLVLSSDSFLFSNEALQEEPQADLLAWLVGPSRNVWFDEAHLGIVEQSGVAGLMRQYRLHGLMAGLLLLAGLFIWQNATSFPPPLPERLQSGAVTGKDAAAGFVNLLRRNIAPGQLLRVCFDEWTKSIGQTRTYSIARVDAAQAALEAENARAKVDRNPARAYREICAALKAPLPRPGAAAPGREEAGAGGLEKDLKSEPHL